MRPSQPNWTEGHEGLLFIAGSTWLWGSYSARPVAVVLLSILFGRAGHASAHKHNRKTTSARAGQYGAEFQMRGRVRPRAAQRGSDAAP